MRKEKNQGEMDHRLDGAGRLRSRSSPSSGSSFRYLRVPATGGGTDIAWPAEDVEGPGALDADADPDEDDDPAPRGASPGCERWRHPDPPSERTV